MLSSCEYTVYLNESVEASFQYFDPTLEVTQSDEEKRDLETYSVNHVSGCNLTDPDLNGGELNIKIPSDAIQQGLVAEGKVLKVSVEFSLEDPKGGVHFVLPDASVDGATMAERAAHMFTYGHENCARLWFPCIDTTSEPCTWKLEFTVDESMTAVSCGELLETVYTPDMKRKMFHCPQPLPILPSSWGVRRPQHARGLPLLPPPPPPRPQEHCPPTLRSV